MSFKDSIRADIGSVFMNLSEFASEHVWGNKTIRCVLDDHIAERARGNVTDVSYDANAVEYGLFVDEGQFEGKLPQMQEQVFFDGMAMTVMSIKADEGMLEILLRGNRARRIT